MANLGHDDISLEPSRLISILVNSGETEEVQNLQFFENRFDFLKSANFVPIFVEMQFRIFSLYLLKS